MSIFNSVTIAEISVESLACQLDQSSPDLQLLDVREPQEVALAHIPGFIHLPLSQFAEWAPHLKAQLDLNQETIVLCHHGLRSAQMCHWLTSQGFTSVKNVAGGIDAYALRVDPSMPRY